MIIVNKKIKCNRFTPTGQCFRGARPKSQADNDGNVDDNNDVDNTEDQLDQSDHDAFMRAVEAVVNDDAPLGTKHPDLNKHHESIGQFIAKKHKFNMKQTIAKHLKGAYTDKTQEVIEDIASHKYSRLANASYTYHATKGKANDVHEELKSGRYSYIDDLKDFKVDKELSTLDDVVLHNKITGETIVSYRGTAVAQDWVTNAKIAFTPNAGQSSKRYANAEQVLFKVMVKYGKEKLKVLGHSQGGGVSSYLGQKFDVESHSFNPAVSLRQVYQNYVGKHKLNNAPHHIYRTDFDGVSIYTHANAIKDNFKIKTLDTVPNMDKNPLHVHGLGDNFAPKVIEELDGDMVKVVRNTKLTSISKGASGLLAAAGVAVTAYETGIDIKDDVSTSKGTGQKAKDVAVDVAKNAGEFAMDMAEFDVAIATAGFSLVATHSGIEELPDPNRVATHIAEAFKDYTSPKPDYSTYTCYGYDCD